VTGVGLYDAVSRVLVPRLCTNGFVPGAIMPL
jgi:hypothetical protein